MYTMHTKTRTAILVAITAGLASCGDLTGFGGAVPALAVIQIQTTGDFASVAAPRTSDPALRVALVWGAQWLTEPLCILPPEGARVAALVAAGCRDPFGFVPERVAVNAPLASDGSAALELFDLPAADVMVGDVTARIAYASLVVYDDVNRDGTLTFAFPNRPRGPDEPPFDPAPSRDLVYAASFVSMTEPDSRIAFREGAFNRAAAFYPRSGCGDPLPSFSIVSAGGFTAAAAIAATLRGQLPAQDPASCSERPIDAPVSLTFRPPSELRGLTCRERRSDSSVRYREPPREAPDLSTRTLACAKVPDFGTGRADGIIQLAVSGRSDDACQGVTHYVLRGCRNDAACERPEWDTTARPPMWWPCPVKGTLIKEP